MIGIMQSAIEKLIPVDGNRYFTAYGFYLCKMKVSEPQTGIIKVKVVLISESDGSQPARVYKIAGTRQAIKQASLSLVMDIHNWALLDRDNDCYWVKKVRL